MATVAKTITAPDWCELWLPEHPRATDNFSHGLYRTGWKQALTRRHIEANPPLTSNLLVVDVDHPDALMRSVWDRDGWRPNVVVENPSNGHAHAIWALQQPVHRADYARRKPLAFAAHLTEGLRRSVDGDAGYSGLMTKNPLHPDWVGHEFTDHLYLFEELAEHLTEAGFMPRRTWSPARQDRRNVAGLGRNCALFETVRVWAYPQINDCWGEPEQLGDRIENRALDLNADFPEPLPSREVAAIANSITRFILSSKMWEDGKEASDARFSERQRYRAAKSAEKRQRKAQARREVIVSMAAQGMRQKQIAAELGVSPATVSMALKAAKEEQKNFN